MFGFPISTNGKRIFVPDTVYSITVVDDKLSLYMTHELGHNARLNHTTSGVNNFLESSGNYMTYDYSNNIAKSDGNATPYTFSQSSNRNQIDALRNYASNLQSAFGSYD